MSKGLFDWPKICQHKFKRGTVMWHWVRHNESGKEVCTKAKDPIEGNTIEHDQ